ncbi:hypothetical protein G4B88_024094 [Cannabis sativa]|uniref:Rx N-terminal domain-containing protein n=1 Tax=Cannabis sativa TaxID=3483 RepID=A0A7J6DRL1_CANSA|nr:hypothetical protein G4B88_024094 [Cannabis sativa]
MAEGVLLDIAATLIEMLISSAFEEIGLLYGAKDKFQELVDTTKVIKGVLLDAEEKMVVDQSVKVWLKQLGDAFFLADDLVDKFHTKLLQHRVMFGNNKFTRHVCIFFSNSNQCLRALSVPFMSIEVLPKNLLAIKKLRHTIKYSASETTSKKAVCEGKHNLQSLSLEWENVYENNNNMVENDEMLLEGLQPPSNLKELHVWHFMGVRFGSWLSSLNNLVKLKLNMSRSRVHVLSGEDDDFDANLFFPSLVTLTIGHCSNLKWWWWKKEVDGNNIRSFPRLSNLVITDCPNLTSMPLFPTIEKVKLLASSSMSLEDTFKMMRGSSKAHNTTHPNISLLRSIHIRSCPSLTSLLVEGIDNLTSLESILIEDCPNLTSVLEGIDNLTSLKSILIKDCPNLTLVLEGIDNLPSFRDISIEHCHNLASLLEGIDNLPSLRSIYIRDSSDLTLLLERIENLPSLKSIYIRDCPNLTSLLEGIDNLPSLEFIYIRDCPVLTSIPDNFRKVKNSFIKNCPKLEER